MSKIVKFEDIEVWKRARKLVGNENLFAKDFSLRD